MKLWILSAGCYSDYHVVGVFDDDHKSNAENIAELIGGSVDANPFELNNCPYDEPPQGKHWFRGTMHRDGRCHYYSGSMLTEDGQKWCGRYSVPTHTTEWELRFEMYAIDGNAATKIANEIRTQILAGAMPESGPIP